MLELVLAMRPLPLQVRPTYFETCLLAEPKATPVRSSAMKLLSSELVSVARPVANSLILA